METTKRTQSAGALVASAALCALLLAVVLHDQSGATAEVAAANDTNNSQSKTETTSYSYTARAGDSYSVLARKAVQTYGIVNKVNLSQAQIVAAETFLTVGAGSPELIEGQKVTLNVSDVKSAVEKAQKLTAEEKAAWQTYVPYVDFDTRDNG